MWVAGGNEEILKSIQVHVEKNGVPRPTGSLQTAELGNLGKCHVSTVQEKRVAFDLRPAVDDSEVFGRPTPPRYWIEFEIIALHLAHLMGSAQHLHDHE